MVLILLEFIFKYEILNGYVLLNGSYYDPEKGHEL